MLYKKSQGNGMLFFIILIIIIAFIAFLWYFDIIGMKSKVSSWKNKASNIKDVVKQPIEPYTPPTDVSWCQAQEIPTLDNDLSPQRIVVKGWDNIEGCCVRSYIGFNQCLNQSVDTEYCYTSSLGGAVIYIKINNVYKSPINYHTYLDDTHKQYNPYYNVDYKCNMEVY